MEEEEEEAEEEEDCWKDERRDTSRSRELRTTEVDRKPTTCCDSNVPAPKGERQSARARQRVNE